MAETRFVTDGAILICHPKFLRGHKKRLNNVSKNNVLAERAELLQVGKVAADFKTVTPLTFNHFSAYLQQLYLVA